ncbi:MAG: putative PurR-regulated permease PerM [Planctomycetota bacterium]
MLERLSKERRNLALTLLAGAILYFGWSVRAVLNPLLLAYVLAYIAHPAVLNLERRGWSRLGAVNVIYGLFFVVTLGIGAGLWAQGSQLLLRVDGTSTSQAGPVRLIENLDEKFEDFIEGHRESFWLSWMFEDQPAAEEGEPSTAESPDDSDADPAQDPEQDPDQPVDLEQAQADPEGAPEPAYFVTFLQRLWMEVGDDSTSGAAGGAAMRGAGSVIALLRHLFGGLFGLASLLVLLPIYAWYLLFDLERIHEFVRRYVPVKERERATRIGSEIGGVISSFFRGRLLVCLVKGLLLSLGLWVAGLNYALFLGVLAGFLSLVPIAGALMGFSFAFLVGLLDHSLVPLLLKTGVVFGAVEAIEGYVLVPKILGDSLGLHPLVVFVAVFVGGAALGMFGLLAALPLTAALVILGRELVLPALAQFADEDPDNPDSDSGELDSTLTG